MGNEERGTPAPTQPDEIAGPDPGCAAGSAEPRAPAIRAQGLNHYFGAGETQKQVLFDIDIEFARGELVILTGPSGSGKTTLLTLIGALRAVQEGSLQAMGRELAGLTRDDQVEYRRGLGFIFQLHNLFASLTAYQNVRIALELHGVPASEMDGRIVEELTYLGLEERLYYKPDSLSGGQRQRVAIARALVNRPKLILADEPTAALDKKSGRDVVTLLQKLSREENATIVMVTHDNRILDVADRIVNMVDGRIASNVIVRESIELCEFLMKSDLFSHLSANAASEVGQKMTKEEFAAGVPVCRQGDPGDKFYIIWEGEVDVIVDKDGTSTQVATLAKGDFFGEAALLTGDPRNANCVASGPCTLYSLIKEDFRQAVDSSPSFRQQLLHVFASRQ